MGKINTKSTSKVTADVDPIVLRETNTTRLVFKPILVDNPHDPSAAVKGQFVFQRKTKDKKWEDIKSFSLAKLKAKEEVKLPLKSAEVLKLYRELTDLYELHQREGIPRGERSFYSVDNQVGELLDVAEGELMALLDRDPENAPRLLLQLLKWILRQENLVSTLNILNNIDNNILQQLNSVIGLKTLKKCYSVWESNRENKDEEFWQNTLMGCTFVLAQVFAHPVIILKEKAYLGGKIINNKGGNIVDFLARNEISKNLILIEIKTPTTPLMGSEYRQGVHSVSRELSGAIIQIEKYKDSLQKQYYTLIGSDRLGDLSSVEPTCVVIIGDYQSMDEKQSLSFELFRAHLHGVEIVTYDELFRKVKQIIDILEGAIKQIS